MPSTAEILAGLTEVANSGRWLAISWHVVLAGVVTAVVAGWRPSRRLGATLTALPLASASAMAWAYGNPFNGIMLGAGAVTLGLLGVRLASDRLPESPPWRVVVGAAVVAYGWVYPHFLADQPSLAYLYAAPVGLVPCPSLSIAIGFAIAASGYGSRRWSLALGVLGLFYAVFGTLRLGVWLDVGLFGAAAILITIGILGAKPAETQTQHSTSRAFGFRRSRRTRT
jgi:hypothetical protein